MKHLLPTQAEQNIKILPRVYTTSIVLLLRDDSTNSKVTFELPKCVVNGNYLDITSTFEFKEGRFYDLKVYELRGSYGDFKERVIADGGTFVDNKCLLDSLKANNLVNAIDELSIIYRDKIFCTAQSTDQSKNEYYSVNKDEYVSKSANNDFIILWVKI